MLSFKIEFCTSSSIVFELNTDFVFVIPLASLLKIWETMAVTFIVVTPHEAAYLNDFSTL